MHGYAEGVIDSDPSRSRPTMLLLDTCGDVGSAALGRKGVTGWEIVQELWLEERTASSALLRTIRELLRGAGLQPGQLAGVGAVAGPGSFTGVRVGMAVAKGLCEASGLPLVAVSRLTVLATMADLVEGFAVLRAGRDELYVREEGRGHPGAESLETLVTLLTRGQGKTIVYAEATLEEPLRPLHLARRVELSASSALPLVVKALADGGTELRTADANYVRDERTIYRRQIEKRAGL